MHAKVVFKMNIATQDITHYLANLYKSYPSPLIDWFGPLPMYFVKEPEEAYIMLTNPRLLQKSMFYKAMQWAFGESIFSTLDVMKWKSHRRALAPTFNSVMLDSYSLVFQKRAINIIKSLEKYVGKGEFNILPEMEKYTLAVLNETAMGQPTSIDKEEDSKYLHNIEQTKDFLKDLMFTLPYHIDLIFKKSKLYQEGSAVINDIYNYVGKFMKEKRQEKLDQKMNDLDRQNAEFADVRKNNYFLDKILDMTGDGQIFNDQECLNEIFVFTAAGSDTCSYLLACTCLMLGMHPEVQEVAYQEIKDLCGDSDREITKNDIQNLSYLECIIKETMRLFPIVNAIARECQDDVQMGSRKIPKGITCALNLIEYHRDPRRWPNPTKFDPNRFRPEEMSKRHPYEFIPFSAGPRNCIGYKYAMYTLVMTMAPIVRAYKFSTKFKTVEELRYGMAIITRLLSGHLVQIEKRS